MASPARGCGLLILSAAFHSVGAAALHSVAAADASALVQTSVTGTDVRPFWRKKRALKKTTATDPPLRQPLRQPSSASIVAALSLSREAVHESPKVLTSLNRARLGNRLFEWAAQLAVAKEMGAHAVIPPSRYTPQNTPQISKLGPLFWEQESFDWLSTQRDLCHIWDRLPVTVDSGLPKLQQWTLAGQPKGENHTVASVSPKDGGNWAGDWASALTQTSTPHACKVIEMDGFFQRPEFFMKHIDWLRQLYWDDATGARAQKVMDDIVPQSQNTAAVAVHLRLGDYVRTNRNLNMSYYEDALEEVKQRRGVSELNCVIFSDDLKLAMNVSLELTGCSQRIPVEPCKGSLTTGRRCPRDDSVDDKVSFYLMSLIPNIVIADSTYSFWAAMLAPPKSLVLAPKVVKPRSRGYEYLTAMPGWVGVKTNTGLTNSPTIKHALNLGLRIGAELSEWAA